MVLASQPFSVLLGTELLDLSAGKAEIRVPIRPQPGQQHGFVHGGVIGYAADNALTFAGGSVLGRGRLVGCRSPRERKPTLPPSAPAPPYRSFTRTL